MPDISIDTTRLADLSLPELPTLIGLFGAGSGASVDATPFDVVVAIATSGGPIGG